MKPSTRIWTNASRICQSCHYRSRRNFSSSAARRDEDLLSSLEAHMNAGKAPTAPAARVTRITTANGTTTTTATPRSSPSSRPARSPTTATTTFSSITSDMRAGLQRQQALDAARQPPAQPTAPAPQSDLFTGALSGMDKAEAVDAMERQMGRRWATGDVYSTHDLGPREGQKWSEVKRRPTRDVFEMVGTDPRRHYKNMPLLSQFVSETGRIKHSNLTGLKPKNQRKLAKAVRRAIGCGLMPSSYVHPELIAVRLGIQDHLKDTGYGRR